MVKAQVSTNKARSKPLQRCRSHRKSPSSRSRSICSRAAQVKGVCERALYRDKSGMSSQVILVHTHPMVETVIVWGAVGLIALACIAAIIGEHWRR